MFSVPSFGSLVPPMKFVPGIGSWVLPKVIGLGFHFSDMPLLKYIFCPPKLLFVAYILSTLSYFLQYILHSVFGKREGVITILLKVIKIFKIKILIKRFLAQIFSKILVLIEMYRYTAFERGKTDVHPSYILQYIICPHRLLFIACIFSTQATFCSICFAHLSYFLQYMFCLSKLLFVTLPTETTIQYIFCPPKFPVTVYILSTLATLYNTYFVHLIFCPATFL